MQQPLMELIDKHGGPVAIRNFRNEIVEYEKEEVKSLVLIAALHNSRIENEIVDGSLVLTSYDRKADAEIS